MVTGAGLIYPRHMELAMESVERKPHPQLLRYVTSYTGYRVEHPGPGTHPGLPSRSLTFIVAFDDPLYVTTATVADNGEDSFWAMLGGLHTRPATVRHPGRQHGLQLAITPLGALALFGVRAVELTSACASLHDIDRLFAEELVHRLSSASDWADRFQLLDALLLGVLDDQPGPGSELECAWSALVQANGSIGVSQLASQVGWSRRHLSERFRITFGLPPKSLARVLRFEYAQDLLRTPQEGNLAGLAALAGYSDQSHMSREWRELAGYSPTEWLEATQIGEAVARNPEGSRRHRA